MERRGLPQGGPRRRTRRGRVVEAHRGAGSATSPATTARPTPSIAADGPRRGGRDHGTGGNRIYYLATIPSIFEVVAQALTEHGGNRPGPGRRIRAAGRGEALRPRPRERRGRSTRPLHVAFDEDQIFRIDHYMGKETVQNVLALRFANAIFEPIWNRRYVDHVQITVAEEPGRRAPRRLLRDRRGAARHRPEPRHAGPGAHPDGAAGHRRGPAASATRRSSCCGQSMIPERRRGGGQSRCGASTGRGRSTGARRTGLPGGGGRRPPTADRDLRRPAAGGRQLALGRTSPSTSAPASACPSGAPRSSLQLPAGAAPRLRGRADRGTSSPNTLILRIQPDEGDRPAASGPRCRARPSGCESVVDGLPVRSTPSPGPTSEAATSGCCYDAMIGDATLFIRTDEVEQAWRIVDPYLEAWSSSPVGLNFATGRVPGGRTWPISCWNGTATRGGHAASAWRRDRVTSVVTGVSRRPSGHPSTTFDGRGPPPPGPMLMATGSPSRPRSSSRSPCCVATAAATAPSPSPRPRLRSPVPVPGRGAGRSPGPGGGGLSRGAVHPGRAARGALPGGAPRGSTTTATPRPSTTWWRCAALVRDETGLLPHANAGRPPRADELRPPACGLGQPGHDDRVARPRPRLPPGGPGQDAGAAARHPRGGRRAGRSPSPPGSWSGSARSRAGPGRGTLEAIADSHRRHGHVQEVIVQNFLPKPGTAMHAQPAVPSRRAAAGPSPSPASCSPPTCTSRRPPTCPTTSRPLLRLGHRRLGRRLAGDRRPRQPRAGLARARRAPRGHRGGRATRWRPASPSIPSCARDPERAGSTRPCASAVLDRADAEGLGREGAWCSGGERAPPQLLGPVGTGHVGGRRRHACSSGAEPSAEVLAGVSVGQEVGEDEIVTLFSARGPEVRAVAEVADQLRRDDVGDVVTWVANRNINYTNVCTFKCRFCAFSKGPLSLNLRGAPYLLELSEHHRPGASRPRRPGPPRSASRAASTRASTATTTSR